MILQTIMGRRAGLQSPTDKMTYNLWPSYAGTAARIGSWKLRDLSNGMFAQLGPDGQMMLDAATAPPSITIESPSYSYFEHCSFTPLSLNMCEPSCHAIRSCLRDEAILGTSGSVNQLISPNSHMETRKRVAPVVDDVLCRDSTGVAH